MKRCVPLAVPLRLSSAEREKWLEGSMINASQKGANLLEIWCDRLTKEEIKNAVLQATLPVLAVCKTGERKLEKLVVAIEAGAHFVDVDGKTKLEDLTFIKKKCKKYGTTLIISRHDWKKTPSVFVLEKYAQSAVSKGAVIVKIATTIQKWSDTSILLELATRLLGRGIRFVLVGMGKKSTVSRIGPALLGGEWTYFALDKKTQTAPGQSILGEFAEF